MFGKYLIVEQSQGANGLFYLIHMLVSNLFSFLMWLNMLQTVILLTRLDVNQDAPRIFTCWR